MRERIVSGEDAPDEVKSGWAGVRVGYSLDLEIFFTFVGGSDGSFHHCFLGFLSDRSEYWLAQTA